jgi:biopolymer transport protein ExbB/TolQ
VSPVPQNRVIAAWRSLASRWSMVRLDGLAGGRMELLQSFFLGITLTAVVFEVFPLPYLSPSRFTALFDNTVSETISTGAAWAMFLLGFKALRHLRERQAYTLILSPETTREVGEQATSAADAIKLLTNRLRDAQSSNLKTTLVSRRLSILAPLAEARGWSAVHANLSVQSEIDAKRLDSGYTTLHVLAWALPLVGFIGTVLGVGDAIGEFSRFAQATDPGSLIGAPMREALSSVTTSLASAFGTTLVALALVVPVLLGTTLLQRAEENLLLDIDEFCLWELGARLGLSIAPGADAATTEWLARIERAGTRFAQQADAAGQQLAGIQPLIREFTDQLVSTQERPTRSATSPGGTEPAPATTPFREPPTHP